jgi:prevent-host-death family protein
MPTTITLRDANQQFSRCIRAVESGEEFIVTRDGRPVAKIVPVAGPRVLTPEQEAAWARLKAAMETGWPIGAGPGMRDQVYEDRLNELDARRRR